MCLEASEGGISIFFIPLHPSVFLYLLIYLSAVWNLSSVVRVQHMISMQEGEPGRHITGNEWTTSLWPNQGRKTHVLLVLASWLPAERVGNSFSRRDGEMEGWKRLRGRRRKSRSPCVYAALTLTSKWWWHIVLFSDMTSVMSKGLKKSKMYKSLWMNFSEEIVLLTVQGWHNT